MKLSPSVDLITYLLTDSQFYFIEGNKPIDLLIYNTKNTN